MVGGTPTVVQMQVVAITDQFGNAVDTDTKPVLEELLEAQQRQVALMEALLAVFGGSLSDAAQVAGFVARSVLTAPGASQAPVNGIADAFGRQIVLPWGPRDMFAVGLSGTITDTSSHVLKAGEPGVYLDLVALLITNTSASTSTRVDISDGTNIYPFQSIGGAGPVGFTSGLILPASKAGVDWTLTAAGAVTDLRAMAVFVRNK